MTRAKKEERLYVFYREKLVGQIIKSEDETLHFQYDPLWREDPKKFELSPAMPISYEGRFDNKTTRAYFENLLPEGHVQDRINQTYRNIVQDSFKFFEKFGEDCAGAFVITSSSRGPKENKSNEYVEVALAELDKALDHQKDLASLIHKKFKGRFSLAGAQDKIAFIFRDEKILIPTKGGATTHILKPPIKRFGNGVDTVFNEYYVMKLAKGMGLKVADCSILQGQYPYYVVERFDRIMDSGHEIQRIHQFDFCQALGYQSVHKYEDSSGPHLEDIVALIMENSLLPVADIQALLEWLFFNLMVGNNDCHSKNISFLKGEAGLKLSPFYDLLSTAVYPDVTSRFAFGFGKKGQKQYSWHKLKTYHFENTAKSLNLHKLLLNKTLKNVATRLKAKMASVRNEVESDVGPQHIFDEIDKEILKRVQFFLRD